MGCAAINALNFIGGFAGPYLWGWSKDTTGSYAPALGVMAALLALAAAGVLAVRAQVVRRRASVAAPLSAASA